MTLVVLIGVSAAYSTQQKQASNGDYSNQAQQQQDYSNQQSAGNDAYAEQGQQQQDNSYGNEEESVTRIPTSSHRKSIDLLFKLNFRVRHHTASTGPSKMKSPTTITVTRKRAMVRW